MKIVSRFSTVTRKETTVDNWDEHYDFPMEDYIYKCLVGDKGDNVPGVQGVGPKRAVTQLWNNMVQFLIYMILYLWREDINIYSL